MNSQVVAPEKKFEAKYKTFRGYVLYTNSLSVAIAAIFSAFTCGLTLLFPLLFPQGFINIGDLAVMITAVLFGPIIGFTAGGIGPMLADFILGYPQTALFTLIIKACEGFVVGFISNPRKHYKKINYQDIVGLIIGGLIMVFGYFFVELYIFRDPGWAFGELPLNFGVQFGVGVIGTIIFIISSRKNIIINFPHVFEKIFILESLETISK
ncbi:MAG: ECF transporter S component [Promethearchaeota archaeon]